MELLRIGIEHIVSLYGASTRRFRLLWLLRGNRRAGLLRNSGAAGGEVAVPGSIVDGDAGLDIVGIDAEQDVLAAVLDRIPLHQHAAGQQIAFLKNGSYPIEHVVVRLLDVVCHHILEGEHPFNVQIPSAGDQVLLVGILTGKLIAEQMTAVIEVLSIHTVVLDCMPAGRLDLADTSALLRRHDVLPYAGIGDTTAPQRVQGAVAFKRCGGEVISREVGDIVVDC